MVLKKEILYPVFLECLKFINDSFWENIFEDLAYGKTPYGTYINKDFLCCNYKNKEFSYKIEKKDPKTLYNDIYSLLGKKLGILSIRDKTNRQIDFQNIENELKECRKNWSNIRKKNIKDLLIEYKHKIRNDYKFYSQDLLNNLFKHPYTKIEFLEQELGISRITAASYLNKLADDGLLRKEKLGTANYYVNHKIYDILSK